MNTCRNYRSIFYIATFGIAFYQSNLSPRGPHGEGPRKYTPTTIYFNRLEAGPLYVFYSLQAIIVYRLEASIFPNILISSSLRGCLPSSSLNMSVCPLTCLAVCM
jgi:hypothetical protein